MAWVSKWCAKCGVCGHEWLPRDPEKYGDPKQCAKCKSWRWNDGHGKTEGNIGAQGMPGVQGRVQNNSSQKRRGGGSGAVAVQRPPENSPADTGAVDGGAQQDTGGEGEREGGRAEEFVRLKPSEQLRAMRDPGYEPTKKNLCPVHGREFRDFGSKWACDGPPFHTELKEKTT